MKKLKLGFAPTQRPVFDKQEAIRFKKMIEEKLVKEGKAELVNIDGLDPDGLLRRAEDADKVADYFKKQGVDAVFFPHCDFGTEAAVARVAKAVGKPVLLWGPRDDAPLANGTRLRDSQCGLFATSKVLRTFGVPFSYITNSNMNDAVFEQGFSNFLSAASVVKAFQGMRIGQISTRPGAFYSVIVDEGGLMEKFGIEIVPITLTEIELAARALMDENSGELKDAVDKLRELPNCCKIELSDIRKVAAIKVAISQWAKRESLSGAAIQCWSALQDTMGVVPCLINGELFTEGFPVACEADIYGAITSVMAQALTDEPVFLADMTVRHPSNDNAELLWHCGNFPYALAQKNAAAEVSCLGGTGPAAIGNWELKEGDITLCRFGGAGGDYSLLMGHAKSTQGPYNRGTYLWAEFKDLPLWEHKFIYGPYIHHCTALYGNYAPALYEACRYIPGLQADPVEPTKEEIEAYLRG